MPVTRQKILITGASSGLGAGMARAFAAKGRDLALCARRIDRLDELTAELLERHPGITVAVASLDVNDHEQVPKVFAELSDELGGIDRVIVNAGIGKGAPLRLRQAVGQQGHHRDESRCGIGADRDGDRDVQRLGGGHLVLVSSVLGNKGVPGVKAAYAASKAELSSLGESLRARIPERPDQGDHAGAGLYRIRDDGQVGVDVVDGEQRDRGQGDGRRNGARGGPGRRSMVAVGAVGAAHAGSATAVCTPFCLESLKV